MSEKMLLIPSSWFARRWICNMGEVMRKPEFCTQEKPHERWNCRWKYELRFTEAAFKTLLDNSGFNM